MTDQEVVPMPSDLHLAAIRKILDRLERDVGLRLAGLQEVTRTVGLAEIRHAKGKLSSGSYGLCEKCGLDMPARQMRDEPLRRVCTSCAEARRSREARV